MRFVIEKCAVNFGSVRALLRTVVLFAGCVLALGAGAAEQDRPLGIGDLLRISVFGYADLTAEVRISESGKITYPLIGEITAAGVSARDLEGRVAKQLTEGGFIRAPQVNVLVLEYESHKVAVLGQINRPGKYALPASSRVVDYLAEAGGVINDVAADRANVLKKDGTRISIDLAALFNGDPEQNIPVAGGDTIYVPKASQFYIYGEVRNPGVYRLERLLTVSRAISMGGGLTPRGSESRTVVKRRDKDGKEVEVDVKGADLIEADDVLYIKERWF